MTKILNKIETTETKTIINNKTYTDRNNAFYSLGMDIVISFTLTADGLLCNKIRRTAKKYIH